MLNGAQRPKAPDSSAPNRFGPTDEDESRKFPIWAHFEFQIVGCTQHTEYAGFLNYSCKSGAILANWDERACLFNVKPFGKTRQNSPP